MSVDQRKFATARKNILAELHKGWEKLKSAAATAAVSDEL